MSKPVFILFLLFPVFAQAQPGDWLLGGGVHLSKADVSKDGKTLTLSNGLLSRSFILQPNAACVDYKNLATGEQLLRTVTPEAAVVINGINYHIGGLYGQKEKAYLLSEWPEQMRADDRDFRYERYSISGIPAYLKWRSRSWAPPTQQPEGKMVSFIYRSQLPELKGIVITVNYELYDNMPLICKWVGIVNQGDQRVHLDQVKNEILGAVEEESAVEGATAKMLKPHGLYVESNFSFNNSMTARLSDQTTHWNTDSTYTSQVSYGLHTPCLLEVYPEKGVGIDLQPGESYTSIRTYELLMDSYDRERNGMAQRKFYRTIAPWSTENPIFMHLVSSDPVRIKAIIDQCAATGYEGVILSFGSGMNIEDTSAGNIQKAKALADYAHDKGILLGGYSLFSSRKISPEDDVISPKTGKPGGAFFGNAPCLGSKWGLAYLEKLKYFFRQTGFDIFENDGPYPGDVCASVTHPGHKGLDDSQWRQMELQKGLYHWMSEQGIYVNAPDWYFLDGTNKIAMGYREVNFALSRAQQIILNRQNIYDATWEKTPSMGWGFVPLTAYHGGDSGSTLEPLAKHLNTYRQLMFQYYGAGIQACYRGPRLYDTEETKAMVKEVIGWYKKYRLILNADVVHLRRPDGRDWDGIMHVSPSLKEKGFALVYNPLKENIRRTIDLPMYFTGLKEKARIRVQEGKSSVYVIGRDMHVKVDVEIPAEGYTWLVIE